MGLRKTPYGSGRGKYQTLNQYSVLDIATYLRTKTDRIYELAKELGVVSYSHTYAHKHGRRIMPFSAEQTLAIMALFRLRQATQKRKR